MIVLAVLAVAGWFAWREWHGSSSASGASTPRPCTTPSVPPSPAAPAAVTVAVLNTTNRVGLAHDIAGQLRRRGFRIGHVGNTTPLVAGVAQVSYDGPDHAQALTVAEQVPGATLVPGGSGVALRIGSGFRALSDPATAAAARSRDVASASPRPPACPSS